MSRLLWTLGAAGVAAFALLQPKIVLILLMLPGAVLIPLIFFLPKSVEDGLTAFFAPIVGEGGEAFIGLVAVGALLFWVALLFFVLSRRFRPAQKPLK